MTKLFLLLFPFLLFSWDEYKKIDNITIYKEHNEKFEFIQFKADTILPFSLDKISSTIMYHHSYTSWFSDCIKADKDNNSVYILMQPPWPLEKRQVWADIKKKVYPNKQVITLISIENKTSPYKAIWFNYLYAEFRLHYQTEHSTKVSLSLMGDPGGYPPSWIINFMAWKIPYQTLNNLNQYLSTKK